DHSQAAVLSNGEAERVRQYGTVGEPALRELPREEVLAADLPGVKVLVPLEQVLDGGHHAALPHEVVVPDADAPVAARRRAVRRGTTRYRNRVVVLVVRVRHAQWPEDSLGGEFAQRLAGDALHDDAEDDVSGVAVVVLRAGREVEVLLPRGELQHVV